MFVVTVTFVTHPGRGGDFLPLMLENARASLAEEPGCHRFDVCAAPDRPDEIFLYELYSDAAAFDVHKGMAHFLDFSAQTAAMVADKRVATYTLLDH